MSSTEQSSTTTAAAEGNHAASASDATIAPLPAAAASSSSTALSLPTLPAWALQRVASSLSLTELAALLCTHARISEAINAESRSTGSLPQLPLPFPALAALPSHVWPALAHSRTMRKHVHTLTVPASPAAIATAAASSSSAAPALSCDPTDRATLQRHFPWLRSVLVAAPSSSGSHSMADLNFAANMRVLERLETLGEDTNAASTTAPETLAATSAAPLSAASTPAASIAASAADDNALPASAPAHASSSSISLSNALAASIALPPSTGSSPTHSPALSVETIEALPSIPAATSSVAAEETVATAASPVVDVAAVAPVSAVPAAVPGSDVAASSSAALAVPAAASDSTPSNSVLIREVPSAPVSDHEDAEDDEHEEEEEPSMIMNHSREDLDVESDPGTPVGTEARRWKGSISIDPDADEDDADEEEGSVRHHEADPDSIVSSAAGHSRSRSPSSTIRRPPNKAAKLLGLGAFESTVSGVSPMNATGSGPQGNGGPAGVGGGGGAMRKKALSPTGQTLAAPATGRPRVSFAGMESVSVSENSAAGSRGASGDYSGLAPLVAAAAAKKQLGTPKASSSLSSNFSSTVTNPANSPPPSQQQGQSRQSSISALSLPSSVVGLPALARRISQSRQELLASFAATGGPLTLVLLGARNLRPAPGTKGLPDPYVSLTAVWNHKKFKSSVQRTTAHPIFNQKFTLNVPPAPVGALNAPAASAATSTTNSPVTLPQQPRPTGSATDSISLTTKEASALSSTATAQPAAATSAAPSVVPSSVTSSASSWSRGVRFRMYHKSALFGKAFLGEVLLDLNALLGLAALQRDVWIPLRDRREERPGSNGHPPSAAVTVEASKQHTRGSTSTTAGSLSIEDENRKSLSIAAASTLSAAASSIASKDSGPTSPSSGGGGGIDDSLSTAAAEALAPPSAASGDRGELHLIVTVDPLSFQAMLKGLASRSRRSTASGSAEISATPPTSTRSMMFSTSSVSNMHGPGSLAPMRSTTDLDDAAAADGGNPLHSPPAAMLRRRSRSDAGATTLMHQPTGTGSEDDSILSPAGGGKGGSATMPAALSGSAAKRAPSPHALTLTPSRRAISMDFSPQALHNRRTILTPVLAGDTPDHSVNSTPSRDGGATTTTAGKSPGLNSTDSSIVGGGPHNSFSTPDKSGANGIESPALSAIRAMYAGSGSKLSLHSPRGGSGTTAEQPDRSPSSVPGVGGFKPSLLTRKHTAAALGTSSPGGSSSDLTTGVTADGKTVSASPHHTSTASPALQLPAAALSSKDFNAGASTLNGSPKAERDDGHASAEAEADETLDAHAESDPLDDTILWSAAEQRKREAAYRKQIGSLKVALQKAQDESAKQQQKMREKMALDHAAQLLEEKSKTAAALATASAAVQAAAAAQKAASASPSSAASASAATTRLETSLRESERKLAAQGVELKALQTALASARVTHARELDLLRSKLMQSAAESAAFAAYKKSSVLYVQSLRGASDTQLLQLQSMGERLESVETALRTEKDRFISTKSKYKQRVIMLAEQLEQTTASLHVLQTKYDKLVDAHRILQSDLEASESSAAELSSRLEHQTQRYKNLAEEMRAFTSRAGVNVSLQLLAVLREVALAKEDLATVTAQAERESTRLAEAVRAREEIEQLRADHARLASENAALRSQQTEAAKEHAVLLELLQAEVASRTDAASTTGGLVAASNGTDSTMKESQQSGPINGVAATVAMNGHSSSNGHASLSLNPSSWLASPLPAASAAPASSSSAGLHSIEGVRSHFSSPAPASSAAAGSYSSAWSQQALNLSAARQQQQSQQSRSSAFSSSSLPLPSPFLALPFTFASSSSSPSSS